MLVSLVFSGKDSTRSISDKVLKKEKKRKEKKSIRIMISSVSLELRMKNLQK